MAYKKRIKKFGRKRDQRRQLMRSLIRSIVLHERIVTTEARAKWIRPYVEKLVTKSADSSLATRRLLLSRFNNDTVMVKKLTETLSSRYKERKGGYLRIIKVEARPGSGRTTAVIEFV